ncbi:protein SRC2 [Ziziphus jujuba]|uniref:Protein SRC2 n=2 Tax=Ziziphus jujuba TaxID=326968 RepID=A0A6P4AEU7_ZIZJJ|nr:protein SRC2 [Ziziphus jujuba]KAH7518987.1 hypothetical protein FEM48_Zijuj09G0229800 [Ziziphus jujuba var. spinosa]
MESSSSSCCCIEMKVISCKDLKAFNFFQKLSVYAVVCIASDDPSKKMVQQKKEDQVQRTPTDTQGDGNPEWNHQLRFDLKLNSDEDHLFLHFNLRHAGIVFGLGGDRTIGEVRIPLKDLLEDASSNGVVRFVSYQVRTSDGKPNGVLNLSYKLIGCGFGIGNQNPNPNPNYAAGSTISGFPSSNSNRIQYPTVEVEPVSIPLPLMTMDQKPQPQPQECYWPIQPQPQPIHFWSHSSYPLFHGHDPHDDDETYYHSPPPPPLPPPHHHHHHHYMTATPESFVYGEREGIGTAGLKDGDGIQGNAYLWN